MTESAEWKCVFSPDQRQSIIEQLALLNIQSADPTDKELLQAVFGHVKKTPQWQQLCRYVALSLRVNNKQRSLSMVKCMVYINIYYCLAADRAREEWETYLAIDFLDDLRKCEMVLENDTLTSRFNMIIKCSNLIISGDLKGNVNPYLALRLAHFNQRFVSAQSSNRLNAMHCITNGELYSPQLLDEFNMMSDDLYQSRVDLACSIIHSILTSRLKGIDFDDVKNLLDHEGIKDNTQYLMQVVSAIYSAQSKIKRGAGVYDKIDSIRCLGQLLACISSRDDYDAFTFEPRPYSFDSRFLPVNTICGRNYGTFLDMESSLQAGGDCMSPHLGQ